jgi:site-specific recombinase XerC
LVPNKAVNAQNNLALFVQRISRYYPAFGEQAMSELRLKAAVRRFLDANRGTIAPATFALYRHYLEGFVTAVGNVRCSSITPAIVLAWNPKYHPVGCVRRLFRWLVVDARALKVNPLDGMRSCRHGSRMRILSRAETVRLLRAAARPFRGFLLAMLETIARPREMRSVRWGDIRSIEGTAASGVDLVAGRCFFRLVRFKGAELRRDRLAVRNIPISRRLGRLLARYDTLELTPEAVVFTNSRGLPWTWNAVRCQFRRLRVRAGVAVDVNGENAVAYSVRHTSATDAVGAGVKGLVLAELMGHSDVRMTQRYVHLRPDHLIEAMGTISEWKSGRGRKNDRPGSTEQRPD